MVETLLLPGVSQVSHVRFTVDDASPEEIEMKSIVSSFPFPNGISISPDGHKVAVASSSTGTVHFYNLSMNDNSLESDTIVELPFAPDNLDFDDEGNLIVSGHPSFLELIKVSKGVSKSAPSWVLSVSPRKNPLTKVEDGAAFLPSSVRAKPSLRYEVKTLYQGRAYGTSSAGLWDTNSKTLYAVGLYEEGLLVCKP